MNPLGLLGVHVYTPALLSIIEIASGVPLDIFVVSFSGMEGKISI